MVGAPPARHFAEKCVSSDGMPIASMGQKLAGHGAARAERTERRGGSSRFAAENVEEREGDTGEDGEERKIRDGIPSVYRCISVAVQRSWTFLLMRSRFRER